MRWLVAILVLANIVFFYWRYMVVGAVPANASLSAPPQSQSEYGDALVLLTEVGKADETDGGQANQLSSGQDFGKLFQEDRLSNYRLVNKRGEIRRLAGSECVKLEPFYRLDTAHSLTDALATRNILASIDTRQMELSRKYLVFLPPMALEQARVEKKTQLRNDGFDSYEIPDGELKNGISVGYFTVHKNALNRLNELVDKGYQAEMEITVNSQDIFSLSLSAESVNKLSRLFWSEISRNYPKVRARLKSCI